jgi:hypothetical protein
MTSMIVRESWNGSVVLADGSWLKRGHCRRCENGLGHQLTQRSTKATGLLLQRDRLTYDDELAPGEKVARRRAVRHRETDEVRRIVAEEES